MNINIIKLTTIAALGAITLTGCVTDPVPVSSLPVGET